MKKVFVGMSGGVDSSVAAALLKQATPDNFSKLFGRPTPKGFRGYDVTGVHLRCWNVDGCAEQDAEDARRAAETLGIPFYTFNFEKEYKNRVVGYMIDGYRQGITPNPDVMCNREIKFGLFLEKALSMGADYVATGHYVRLRRKSQKSDLKNQNLGFSLLQAKDLNKDQSYFLWTLTQDELRHCLFPIGDYTKPHVRRLAKKFNLPNAEKKDSQGICFLGKVTLADFLQNYIPERRGNILSTAGEVLGEHRGAEFYTIGQRHLGVNFQFPISNFQEGKRVDRKPFYVAEKDVKKNTLVVAEGSDHSALSRRHLDLYGVHLINGYSNILKNMRIRVFARVRYRQPVAEATLELTTKNLRTMKTHHLENSSTAKLTFEVPQKFVAPGQSAVLYKKNGEMIGGGIIAETK